MAIIRTGHVIGRISGTLGSEAFVNGRGSSYVRRRPRKTNQHTIPQLNRRSRFAVITQAWQSLTASDRQAWRTAARLVTFNNRVGVPRSISGFQFFVRFSLNRRADEIIWIFGPPGLTKTPNPDDIVLTASAAGSIELNFNISSPSGFFECYVQAARPVSGSPRLHFSNWKFLKSQVFGVGARTLTFTSEFDALFGHPAAGEFIAARLHCFKEGSMFSPWVPVSALVTA